MQANLLSGSVEQTGGISVNTMKQSMGLTTEKSGFDCIWNFIFFKMSRVPNGVSQFSTECILEVRLLKGKLAEAQIRQITST
jgi:hypothetical protein